jgi:hypothetical protein
MNKLSFGVLSQVQKSTARHPPPGYLRMKTHFSLKSPGCWSLNPVRLLGLWLSFGMLQTLIAQDAKMSTIHDLRAARAKLADKPRRLIANNDGCDALYFPRSLEPTVKKFIDQRTSLLAGSHVGTVSYCTISSGFGQFTHDTRVGAVLTRQGVDYGIRPDDRNITADLIQQGTDTLRAVTDFAHANGMESFWSMRMNDTHDVEHKPERPYFLFPQLKLDHPDWLVGDHVKRTPHGRWSSVDYARPEIRDLAFRYVEEVCRNYDVDGVELDFFRHLCYFKSVANGGNASPAEVAAMTDLMRRIRLMTEEIGLKRQRPILVSMRVPDSPAFSLESGLDVDTWLKEGLMDLVITTDYFRLNAWERSVEWGHQHGVKVYLALTDPRVKHETRFKRASVLAYRARAANAWASGADGLYLFNLYDIDRASPLWSELGDPQKLAFTDKEYFLTDLDGKPASWLANGNTHQTIPVVTPTTPVQLSPKQGFNSRMMIADDLQAAASAGHPAKAALHVDLAGLDDARRVTVTLNGQALPAGELNNGWLDWSLTSGQLVKGENDIAVRLHPAAPSSGNEWSLIYDGSGKPGNPWRCDNASPRVYEESKDGGLLIADRGTNNGDYRYYRAAWGAEPDAESVVEAKVKVLGGSSYLILANGIGGERIVLSPDGVGLFHRRNLRYAMNTTDEFHRYRVVIQGAGLQLYVDDVLRLTAADALAARSGYPRNEIAFGTANSSDLGEAIWGEVKVRSANISQPLQDIVVSIQYAKD